MVVLLFSAAQSHRLRFRQSSLETRICALPFSDDASLDVRITCPIVKCVIFHSDLVYSHLKGGKLE